MAAEPRQYRRQSHSASSKHLTSAFRSSFCWSLQRCLAVARAYTNERRVEGGKTLLRYVPLHVATLAKVSQLYRVLTHLSFGAVVLLGKSECGTVSADEVQRLRLLTPVVKAFAADRAPLQCSRGVKDIWSN